MVFASWSRAGWVLAALLCLPAAGQAHYNMLFPQPPAAQRGESVSVLYQWGHPFEHELFDAPAPHDFFVLMPNGQRMDLLPTLLKISEAAADGKRVAAYRCPLVPPQRGDYTLVLVTPPIWMEEDAEFLQDSVKAILHVQSQNGWEQGVGNGLEVVPLTRPYGLQPGMAYQAQVRIDGRPAAKILVEVELYHASPPARLPPDVHITRTVQSDAGGSVVCSLTEPGWWGITAQRRASERSFHGKSYPLRQRATLWVFVDGAIPFHANRP